MQADLYRPTTPRAALLLVHGLSRAGRRHAELVRLARLLARHGQLVLVPQLEGLVAFRLDGTEIDEIRDALGYPRRAQPGRRHCGLQLRRRSGAAGGGRVPRDRARRQLRRLRRSAERDRLRDDGRPHVRRATLRAAAGRVQPLEAPGAAGRLRRERAGPRAARRHRAPKARESRRRHDRARGAARSGRIRRAEPRPQQAGERGGGAGWPICRRGPGRPWRPCRRWPSSRVCGGGC